VLCIGGEDKRAQLEVYQREGVHIVVATPGRLRDYLQSKKMNLNLCKYFCLDEADRMLDLGECKVSRVVVVKYGGAPC